jgi:hypothetical protein
MIAKEIALEEMLDILVAIEPAKTSAPIAARLYSDTGHAHSRRPDREHVLKDLDKTKRSR